MNKTWCLDQTSPLFRQGKILKIIDICSLQMGQFMYSYNHRILPEAFLNLFQKHNEFIIIILEMLGKLYFLYAELIFVNFQLFTRLRDCLILHRKRQ